MSRFRQWFKKQLTPLGLFLWVFVYPGIPFVVGSLALVIYANFPQSVSDVNLPKTQSSENLTLVIHGLRDFPGNWAAPMAQDINGKMSGMTAVAIDWEDQAKDMFRCSRNGAAIGKRLAHQIEEIPGLEKLHLVAHSCGAFVSYNICRELKANNSPIKIHSTYLDPVSIYRGLDWNYGVRHFGSCADVGEAFIDVTDGVPGSNVPLKHGKTFDVTGKKPADYPRSGHLWPIDYYWSVIKGFGPPRSMEH